MAKIYSEGKGENVNLSKIREFSLYERVRSKQKPNISKRREKKQYYQ